MENWEVIEEQWIGSATSRRISQMVIYTLRAYYMQVYEFD